MQDVQDEAPGHEKEAEKMAGKMAEVQDGSHDYTRNISYMIGTYQVKMVRKPWGAKAYATSSY